jgi:predicted ATPase/transcriptional regulator with XRE-family HTH domain
VNQSNSSYTKFATAGEFLRYLRRRARLSQRELSIAVGYSESHISRIENNERPVDRASLLALFVPSLGIESEPDAIARLLALAERTQLFPSVTSSANADRLPEVVTSPAKHNRLPVQLTSFIGRTAEVAELCDLLADSQTRLITLTGAGGCGKTRLALRVGEAVVQTYRNGVWLVELEPVADPELLVRATASAFDLTENVDESLLASLTEFLRYSHTLLILDNCEHLIDAAAQLAATLLKACPSLQIMVTSRENLAIPGEVNYVVQPLALPPALPGSQPRSADIANFDAIHLFAARAKIAQRTFELVDDNAPAVARICQRLDGIPLGIELAAAWLPLLSPEQIASRLEQSLDLPPGTQRARLPRHQTLAATIAWSYQLLTDAERALLRRLSVFNGGWSLQAAEAIAGGLPPLAEDQVLTLLQRLVHKSLVAVERLAEGDVRYRFLETIREFARQQLAESGEVELVRNHHLTFYVTLAERAELRLKSGRQLYWLALLDQDQENLRAALAHSLTGDRVEEGLRLAGALGHYWEMRYHLVEADRWCQALLDAAQDHAELQHSPWRAKALWAAGMAASYQHANDRALSLMDESLAICREVGDVAGMGAALCFIAVTQDRLGQPREAIATYQEAIEASQRAEDTWWIAEHFH